MRVQESWLDSASRLFKYEDRLSDAEGLLTGFFDSVGFAYDRAALKKAIDEKLLRKEIRPGPGSERQQVARPPGGAGGLEELRRSRVEAAVIEERFGTLLAKCGYER